MSTRRSVLDIEDADREIQQTARIITRSTPQFLKAMDLVSETYLGQVLLALWEAGMYEYIRKHENTDPRAAAVELGLDAEILQSLIDYLVGRGLMRPDGAGYMLTDKGQPYWNYVTRGVLVSHVGGYLPMLTRLGPLLRKEITLNDPSVDRVGALVAGGANYTLLGSGTVEWVCDVIKRLGGRIVLDLGCGAGAFLIQMARKWPDGGGIGIDFYDDAIAEARLQADRCGVSGRVSFYQGELSKEPIDLPRSILNKVDTITAMYVLHEFAGQGGAEAIRQVLAALREQFPGRKLILAEGTRADPVQLGESPPRNSGQLDYSFIHPLSRQGPLRTPEEWQDIIRGAGAALIERIPGFRLVPAWMSLYVVGL